MIFALNSDSIAPVRLPLQTFGGSWTEEKLERVRKYLVAYATIMNKQQFRFAYIDAFAGTGYRALKRNDSELAKIFPEVFELESQQFLEGSARIALQIRPHFTKYIFIERDINRIVELEKLKSDFRELSSDIMLINADANSYLQDLCLNRRWTTNRAVLFLDPFGMQVTWETIVAIAKTRAIRAIRRCTCCVSPPEIPRVLRRLSRLLRIF